MKKTKIIMGMPITVQINGKSNSLDFKEIFEFFKKIDNKFSTYKKNSEISRINRGKIEENKYSLEMKKILSLSERTRKETDGFFDIRTKKGVDPSGIVKGYAILKASNILKKKGYKNFYIEAGGDIQTFGINEKGNKWKVGIRNPFNKAEIVKVIEGKTLAVATSGNYERGLHIYNPKTKTKASEISSITVIGKNIFDADRFATAAFAMGVKGIELISRVKGLEGYMITKDKKAIYTKGFEKYVYS